MTVCIANNIIQHVIEAHNITYAALYYYNALIHSSNKQCANINNSDHAHSVTYQYLQWHLH